MPPATPKIITKSRTYDYRVAAFDHARAMDLTGLEYIQALVSGQLGAKPSIFDTIGVSVPFDLEHGRASVEADPADFLMNPLGVLLGGFASTMLSQGRKYVRLLSGRDRLYDRGTQGQLHPRNRPGHRPAAGRWPRDPRGPAIGNLGGEAHRHR